MQAHVKKTCKQPYTYKKQIRFTDMIVHSKDITGNCCKYIMKHIALTDSDSDSDFIYVNIGHRPKIHSIQVQCMYIVS